MLTRLTITDYAIISRLDVSFESGFSVITGETGTGKSIILGAIALLLGAKADTKAIREGARQCKVEAQFDLSHSCLEGFFDEADIDFDGSSCIVTRIVTAQGKSRSFINDVPCTVAQLRELGEQLIDIHSQHKNLLLHTGDFQLSVLDILAHNQQRLADYAQLFNDFCSTRERLHELALQKEQMEKDADYVAFQLEQLQEANLQSGEAEELEDELNRLEHAQELMMNYDAAVRTLDDENGGIVGSLRSLTKLLEQASAHDSNCQQLLQRADEAYIDMRDLAGEIEGIASNLSCDPQRQQEVEQRLDTINGLLNKHHVQTVGQLLEIRDKLMSQITSFDDINSQLSALNSQLSTLNSKLLGQASELTQSRKAICTQVTEGIERTLASLGMANLHVHVDITPKEAPTANGMDNVLFTVSSGDSSTRRPLSTLSGGEAARVMLAIKDLLTGAVQLPTIIFDEIDTGVSGRIAESMATIMQRMGREHRQVISITHLPQIAALGDAHYRVYKEQTSDVNGVSTDSHIERLDSTQRVTEIAAMLSGDNITDAAMANARQLLHDANNQ